MKSYVTQLELSWMQVISFFHSNHHKPFLISAFFSNFSDFQHKLIRPDPIRLNVIGTKAVVHHCRRPNVGLVPVNAGSRARWKRPCGYPMVSAPTGQQSGYLGQGKGMAKVWGGHGEPRIASQRCLKSRSAFLKSPRVSEHLHMRLE